MALYGIRVHILYLPPAQTPFILWWTDTVSSVLTVSVKGMMGPAPGQTQCFLVPVHYLFYWGC